MTDGPSETTPDAGDRWARDSLRRWRAGSAAAAASMLLVLAWAPTKELLQPWRSVQSRYNALAQEHGLAPVTVRVRQIWLPDAQRADRCGSCHLGMAGEAPLGRAPFTAHPPVPHAPESLGCTYCHSGQGRATVAADAHGAGGTWPHPIFHADRIEAGCGTCHSGVELPLPEDVEGAEELVAELGCLGCHAAGGDGAGRLDGIALAGIPEDWVARHRGLILPEESTPLGAVDAADIDALNAWLRTRIGAPHLARGKIVFQQLGCMGCHRRGAVGGDVGPDLSEIGDRDARELAPEAEVDTGTVGAWLREHVLAPQQIVEGSRMPPLDPEEIERESDIDDLVTYLLSLRGDFVPRSLTPPDRARVEFGLGRDFPIGGRGLYATFCSACHGAEGEGRELEILEMVTPMIGTRGSLATVTPRYLRDSVVRGRRGRYMPAWGPEDGGLEPLEIDAIVDYLISQAWPVTPIESLAGRPDPANGQQVFEERCAFCHASAAGEPRFGSDLLGGGGLRHFSRAVLYQAIARGWVEEGMPSFSFLRANDLRDLLAFLQSRAPGFSGPAFEADGEHSPAGHQLWTAKCEECHGARGEGGEGPMLNSEPYLEWAADSYLAARVRHHAGAQARAAVGNPSADDLDAILDYVRSWTGQVAPPPPPTPDAAAVARGRALYPSRCTECHGEGGRGKTGTALASPDFLSVITRPFLVMTILEGRKGTPMRAWREQQEKPVSLQDAYDLADFILSLGSTPADRPASTAEPQRPPNQEVER